MFFFIVDKGDEGKGGKDIEGCTEPPSYINAISHIDSSGNRVTYRCNDRQSPCQRSDTCRKIVEITQGQDFVLECRDKKWIQIEPWEDEPSKMSVLPNYFLCPRCLQDLTGRREI